MQVLDDGSYLARLNPARKADGPPMTVRVIEYTVHTSGPEGAAAAGLASGIRSRKGARRQRDAEQGERPDPDTPPVCGKGSTAPSLNQASMAGTGSFGTH